MDWPLAVILVIGFAAGFVPLIEAWRWRREQARRLRAIAQRLERIEVVQRDLLRALGGISDRID